MQVVIISMQRSSHLDRQLTCTSYSSAMVRALSITSGVAPQSSCTFKPQAPASIMSLSELVPESLPFPVKPKLRGIVSVALIMFCM